MDDNNTSPQADNASGGKKYIKYLIIFGIVILFIYSLVVALNSKKQAGTPSPSPQTLSVPTKQGETLQVKDFTKNPVEKVGDTMAIDETPNFSIVYFTKDQSFLITLSAEPL